MFKNSESALSCTLYDPLSSFSFSLFLCRSLQIHESTVATVIFSGSIVSCTDPVETRGRLWGKLEDLLAGGGRMTGSVARNEQFGRSLLAESFQLGSTHS